MKNRFIAYDLEKKTYKTLIEFPCLHPQWRTNDCKASPEGRIWCGVMHCSEHNGNGSLYCVDNDLSLFWDNKAFLMELFGTGKETVCIMLIPAEGVLKSMLMII